jgi:hypothetical protein
MPIYELQTPDGKTYEVEAPDVDSAVKALESMSPPTQPAPAEAPAAAAQPGYGEDMAKGFGAGVVQGAIGLAGMPQDLGRWLGEKAGYGMDRLMGISPEDAAATSEKARAISQASPLAPPSSQAMTQGFEGTFGPMYEPQTTPGQYAQTLGQFVPGMAIGPGSVAQRVVSGTSAALGSEAAGQATDGTAFEPYARLGGALLGGIAPDVARRAVTPMPIAPERAKQVKLLGDEGVDLTAGQKTGSKPLQYLENELGGGKAANVMERQGEQFTAAAAKRAGINADRLTPDVMDQAFTRIGGEFDNLAARNALPPDPTIATDVANAVTDYAALVPTAAQPNSVRQYASDLLNAAQNGMTGAQYQSFRSRLTTLARSSSDPQLSSLYRSFADALDDGMERSLAAAGSPDLGAWREIRNQYRNVLVLEKTMMGAGEKTAEGLVSPSQLRSATVQKQGGRNYVRGKGDFAKLARAGESTMKPLPQSGTAPRINAQNLGAGFTGLLGAGIGAAGGAQGAMLGGLLGMGVPFAAGRALMSRPVQAYLANQLLPGRGLPAAQRAVIPLLGVAPQISGPR